MATVPAFSSPSTAQIFENSARRAQVLVAQVPGYRVGEVSYKIDSTVLDGGLFAIDFQSGAITLLRSLDFENPADANGDNVYEIVITATK